MGPGSRGESKALPGVEAWPQLHDILLNHWDLTFSSYIAKGEEIWAGPNPMLFQQNHFV